MMEAKGTMFLLVIVGGCTCAIGTLRECVKPDSDTLACVNEIPAIIPKGVSRVFLEFVSDISFEEEMFYHASWRNITHLDITAKYVQEVYRYYDFNLDIMRFGRLENLQELKVHGDRFSRVSIENFRHIPHLSVLEFSNCQYLEFKTLIDSLL